MPDKIKEVFEATKDNGIFLDEEDFRSSLSKEPKAVFELFKADKKYADLFLDYDDFENSLDLKKKDFQGFSQELPKPAMPSGEKFTQGIGLGVKPISSTASPSASKQPKSTIPSESTDGKSKQESGFPLKQDGTPFVPIIPNLEIGKPWKEKTNTKEFELPKQYTPEKPYIEADIQTRQALDALPAYSRSVIGNGYFKREFAEYLKQNPKDAQKMIAWKGGDVKAQAEQYDVLTKFYRQKAEPLVLKLEEYDAKGVGAALEKANQVYVNLDKVQDELKKSQSQVNFYLNTYLEQNGYSDIVKQAKELKGKINSFDAKAFDETEKSIKKELDAVEAEIQPLVVNGSIPQENYQQYLELKSRADSLVAEYNGLIQSPEALEYNKNVADLNELIASQNELATGLQSNSQYKKAFSSYEAVSKKYTDLISQAQQFDDMKKDFKDYISIANQVSDITKKYDNISRGFPDVISRNELQKKIDILGEQGDATKAKSLGILQSLPQSANSIFSGIGSALAKMDKVMQGADDKDYYSVYDKMSDYYDNLNKFNSFIVPSPKAIRKDGSLNWSELGYEALSQWGNMAIFASVGGYGKAPMVGTAYFMSRKQREEEAEEAGLTGASKEAYVSTLSTLEGLSELIMPDNRLFTAPIKKLLLKEAVMAQSKGINWFRKRALAVVLENSGKEAAEEYVVKLGELMQKVASNYSNGNAFDLSEYKNVNEWIRTGLVAAPLAGLSSSVSQINVPKKELEVARYEAAKNLTQARDILDDLVEGKKMTAEKADAEYKKIVNYAAVQSIIPKDISNNKAVELVPLLIENEKLKLQMENVDEVFKEGIKEKINANIEKAKEILNQKEEKIVEENIDVLPESPMEVEENAGEKEVAQEGQAQEEVKYNIDEARQQFIKDNEIEAFQEKFGYQPYNPFESLPDGVYETILRVEDNTPTSLTAIEEASNWLYSQYKMLEAKKVADTRDMTIPQIDEVLSELEGAITELENFKNKLYEESGQAKGGQDTTPVQAVGGQTGQGVRVGKEIATPTQEVVKSENKASEPSKSDKNYQDAQNINSIVSKENPDASVLIQPKGDNLALTAIYVGKGKRRGGIGSKALETIKREAKKLGKKVVLDATNELDQETDLKRLGNFYERNGFKKVGENTYEYDPKNEASSRDTSARTDNTGAEVGDTASVTDKRQSGKKPIKESQQIADELLNVLGLTSEKTTKKAPVNVSNKSELSELENQTKGDKKTIIESAKKALATLKSVFPDMEIYIHEDTESYNEVMRDEVGGVENSTGNFAFERDENNNPTGRGRIDINLSVANNRTVAHEVSHAIMLKAFGDSPALFKSFRNKIAATLKESSNKALMDFANQYVDKQGNLLDVTYEEYLAELTGALAAQQGKISPTTLQKIATLINEIVSKITNGKLKPFENTKDTKEIIEFFNNISKAIREGDVINNLNDKEAYSSGVPIPVSNFESFVAKKVSEPVKSKSQIGDYKFPDNIKILKTADLPIKNLTDLVKQYEGKVVIITSDATGYGVDKNGDPIFGGFGFSANAKNVNDGIGFASVSIGTVKGTYTAAEKAYGEGKSLVLVMIQPPHTTINNSYGSKYIIRGIKEIASQSKEELAKTKEAIKEFIKNSTAIQNELKTNETSLKRGSENKLIELIDNIDENTDLDTAVDEFIADTTFTIRKELGKGIILENKDIRTNKSTNYAKIALNNAGYNIFDFLKEYGDNTFLSDDIILNNTGGFVVGGFELDILPTEQREELINNIQNKGIVHPLFNAKLPGSNHFRLDGLYDVQENFSEYVRPETVINLDQKERDKLVRKYYTEDRFYSAQYRSIPLNKRTYTQLTIPSKTEFKEKYLRKKGALVETIPNIATKVAKGEGFIPKAGAAKQMAEATMVSKPKDAASAISEYNEATPAKKQNLKSKAQVAVSEETGFVPVSFWVEQLKGNIGYLDDVVKHILDARQELKEGKVTENKVIKSYLITLASMGSGGGWYSSWKDKTKQIISDIFLEKKNGKDWIRPEGAGAAYLVTPEGKKLVKDIIAKNATQEQVKDLFSYVGFGRENSKAAYVIKTMKSDGVKAMTDLFNKNKGRDFAELYRGAMKLEGIGEGKTGFFNQYFGVSERGVIDARELNAWVAGSMKLTPEQKEKVKKAASSKKIGDQLLGYIEQVGIELGYPKDLAGYIAHHAIWDGIANSVTTHAGEYSVVSKSQKAQDNKIKEFVESQRKAGKSDSNIKAALELIADRLGLSNSDIDILMSAEAKKFPKNVLAIAEETGLSPQQIENTYKKYDGSKDVEEITIEDYKNARATGDKAKLEVSAKAFDALLQQENAKTSTSPTAKKNAEKSLKEADEKALKESSKIMEHINEIRAKLQESGIIKSTSCKWGK